jgi:hypothetical protein
VRGTVAFGRGDVLCGRNALYEKPNGSRVIALWRHPGSGEWLGPCHAPADIVGAEWPDLGDWALVGEYSSAEEVAASNARDLWAFHALTESRTRSGGAFGHIVDREERHRWDWRRSKGL